MSGDGMAENLHGGGPGELARADAALRSLAAWIDTMHSGLVPRRLSSDEVRREIGRRIADISAATRTDRQVPADETAAWASVCEELHLDSGAPHSAVVGRLRLLKQRYERLSMAAEHVVPDDDVAAVAAWERVELPASQDKTDS